MRTILITGGTDGIGKQLVRQWLRRGERVIVVGRSAAKGERLQREAEEIGGAERLLFFQADLSLVAENKRIIETVGKRFDRLDRLVLCAQLQTYSKSYETTPEGFESRFALYYLSRFVLSYQFRDLLAESDSPLIVNVSAPGTKGSVAWGDLQLQLLRSFNSIKAIMHGSKLNELLGAAFAYHNRDTAIKYVLFNPGAVRTAGAMGAFDRKLMRLAVGLMYRLVGQTVERAAQPILHLADSPPDAPLTAYRQAAALDISRIIPSTDEALKLYHQTMELLKQVPDTPS